MGIKGLLAALKPFTEPVHVSKYAGQQVGIDAYSWLHKGAYGCGMEVCEQQEGTWKTKGRNTMPTYVRYCMHLVNMLRYNNVIPIVVFDGGYLPLKAATENGRRRRREIYLELAREKLSQGDTIGATELFQRAVDVSPKMANELIKVLRAEGVGFVVAPYEADAQLAWLSKLKPCMGGVSAVVCEDSDLLTYGCPVVMFKMDKYGNGQEISQKVLFSQEPESPRDLSFRKFSPELFVGMCVLAGCDFLPSIPGIGVKKAHALLLKYGNIDRVLSILQVDKQASFPEGYIADFKQAMSIFHHARVYDASKKALTFLNPIPRGFQQNYGGCIDFLGPDLPPSRAKAIALGLMDPITMCAFDVDVSVRRPCTISSQNSGVVDIVSPTSVLDRPEVVDLSDSEETADCFIICEQNRVHNRTSPLQHSTDHIQSRHEVSHYLGLVSNSYAATLPDRNFLTQLQHIATSMRDRRNEEDVDCLRDSLQEVAATPRNNPFKRRIVSDTTFIPSGEQSMADVDLYGNIEIGFVARSSTDIEQDRANAQIDLRQAASLDSDTMSFEDYLDNAAPSGSTLVQSSPTIAEARVIKRRALQPEVPSQFLASQLTKSLPFSQTSTKPIEITATPTSSPSFPPASSSHIPEHFPTAPCSPLSKYHRTISTKSTPRLNTGIRHPDTPWELEGSSFVPCSPLKSFQTKSPAKENLVQLRYCGASVATELQFQANNASLVQSERKPLKPRNGRTPGMKLIDKTPVAKGGILKFFQPVSKQHIL